MGRVGAAVSPDAEPARCHRGVVSRDRWSLAGRTLANTDPAPIFRTGSLVDRVVVPTEQFEVWRDDRVRAREVAPGTKHTVHAG